MAQIIQYTVEQGKVFGTVRDKTVGNPERFTGFSLDESQFSSDINEESIAQQLGIELTEIE